MTDRTRVTIDGAIAVVCLSRPDKRNGLDLEMFRALIAAGEQIKATPSVRAVVLHGEGKAFCAGLDFASFQSAPQRMQELLARDPASHTNVAQRVAWIWQEIPVPVIAAVHGVAFGGGLQIALGADLRYVTADTQLSVMEVRWGLVPDMGITQTLLPLVALDVAKELTFTGRIVSGAEAVAFGLATRVSQDPLADALETARLIATKSPHAIRAGKRLLRDAATLPRKQAFELETELQLELLFSPNQLEALAANMARREPVFVDPGEAGGHG
jgi:enoyl-CoA hydratase/carnithine racemase